MNTQSNTPTTRTTAAEMMRYIWLLVIAWTLIIAGLVVWNLFQTRQVTQQIAIVQARANFNKDQALRFWATSHGGVYVPTDDHTSPSPYLSHIPERDIETPSGIKLTLMNPAYMIRQMNEEFADLYGIVGHITSLNVLRPANAPDDWERAALESFERGEAEALEFTYVNDEPYLRLMQPIFTQQGCLKCHGQQGYQVGDVRGGVGIALPMAPLLAKEGRTAATQAISLGLLWALGLGVIVLGGRSLNQRTQERDLSVTALQKSEERLRASIEELREHRKHLEELVDERTSELKQEITERRQAEEALREYQQRLEVQNADLRKLTQAVEQSANTVVITDLEGHIEYANPKFVETTGYTVEEALGQNPRILKSGEQSDAYYRELWQTITSGREWRGEFHNKRKDGTLYWELASIAPIYDAQGQMTHFIAAKEDITERKRAEDALRRSNQELALLNRAAQTFNSILDQDQVLATVLEEVRRMLDVTACSIWLTDVETGELVCRQSVGPHSEAVLGLCLAPGEGLAGWVVRSGESLIVPDAQIDERYYRQVEQQVGMEMHSVLSVSLHVKDDVIGVLQVMDVSVGRFGPADQALLETLSASAAIAIDNARLVQELRRYTAELQARNEELDAFAHTAAHDLKGPLGPIVGVAQVLEQGYVPLSDERLHDYLRKIARNGRKMGRIIDELLLLAESRKIKVGVKPLDMARIVAEARERLADMIAEQQAEVILPAEGDWPAALGYGPWVEEVWANYLSNAIKYGGRPDDGAPPRVELGFDELANKHIRFWVRDNGRGLTPEEQARLFTPFTRLDQVRAKGHGLGLSIVRRIVEKLDGEVGVESEIGSGSLFWFTLPAQSQ